MVGAVLRKRWLALMSGALLVGAGILGAAWLCVPSSAPVVGEFMAYQLTDEDRAPDRFLVRFSSVTSGRRIDSINAAYGVKSITTIPGIRVSVLSVPDGSTPEEMIEAYSAESNVEFAEADWVYRAAAARDTHLSRVGAPPLDRVGAPQAWEITTGSPDVHLAVLDTGIDASHPDFSGRMSAGYDFANDDPDPADDNGHGTASAGIAAAAGDDGTDVAGMDWRCTLIPLKVLDSRGLGYASDIARGLVWAADSDVDVIVLGMAGPQTDTLDAAVAYTAHRGSLLIAPAGDDGLAEVSYPAACAGVIAVGATRGDDLAYFSNCGTELDVCAPGVSVRTTAPGGGDTVFSGTSAAAPFVAGLATLMLARNPSLSADEVAQRMFGAAHDLGDAGFDDVFGWGRIDAAATLRAAEPQPDAAP